MFLTFLIGSLCLHFFLNIYLFFLRGRERQSVSGGGAEREREKKTLKAGSRLPAVGIEPDAGLEPMNREIVT